MAAVAADVLLGLGVVAALAISLVALRRTARARRSAPPQPPSREGEGGFNVGVVRFNAYHDTGGDYSFAVALVDSGGDGVVLSGLYHRDQCRVYAKPVRGWTSSYTLTDEELQAIDNSRHL